VPGQDGWDHYVIDLSKKINHEIHEKVEGLAWNAASAIPLGRLVRGLKPPAFSTVFFSNDGCYFRVFRGFNQDIQHQFGRRDHSLFEGFAVRR
jgi:hypothetical protein